MVFKSLRKFDLKIKIQYILNMPYKDTHKIKSHLRQTREQQLKYRFRYVGMKTVDWDILIYKYENIKYCELCDTILNKEHKTNKRICLDHHHHSGYVRYICCQKCNGGLSKVDRYKDVLHLELYRYFNRK